LASSAIIPGYKEDCFPFKTSVTDALTALDTPADQLNFHTSLVQQGMFIDVKHGIRLGLPGLHLIASRPCQACRIE
jgi:hypothetical protein